MDMSVNGWISHLMYGQRHLPKLKELIVLPVLARGVNDCDPRLYRDHQSSWIPSSSSPISHTLVSGLEKRFKECAVTFSINLILLLFKYSTNVHSWHLLNTVNGLSILNTYYVIIIMLTFSKQAFLLYKVVDF